MPVNLHISLYLSLVLLVFIGIQPADAQITRPSEQQVQIEKVFIEANKEKVLENYDDAAYLFEEVLKKDKTNHAAYFELAKINMIQKSFGKAKKNAQSAINNSPKNLFYHGLLAEIYDAEGDYDKAATVYESMTKINPDEIDFYFKRAEYNLEEKKFDQALKIYNEIEKKLGPTQQTTAAKYSIHMEQKKPVKAAAEIENLVNAFPRDPDYKLMLADHYEYSGEPEKAAEMYKEVLKVDPENDIANLALAQTLKASGNDTQYLQSLQEIFSNPDINIDVKIKELVPFTEKVGNTTDEAFKKEAISLAETLTKTHDDAKAFSIYGDMLNYADRPNDALTQYKKAIALNKNVFSLWEQILFINNALGQNDELLKNSEDAMDIFPNQAIAYFFNGVANSRKGDHEEAIDVLRQAAMMSGKNVPLKEQIFIQLGTEYHNLKKSDQSDEFFDKALQLNDSNPLTLNNYSYFLSVRGEKLEKAQAMIEKALKAEPNQPNYLDTYGWVLYKQKKYKDAKKWIKKAIDNGGHKSPDILENYGDTLFQLNEVNGAVEYWQKALDAGGSDELKGKISSRKIVK